MKITVTEERVFPTLGIIAQSGDVVDVPDEDAVVSKSAKPSKTKSQQDEEIKDGDSDGITSL